MSRIGVLAIRRVPWLLVGAAVLAGVLTFGSAVSRAAAPGRVGMIAFMRLSNDRVFRGRLFVIRPDGSGLRALTPPGTVEAYAWSPDGSSIAYIDQNLSLWLVRLDGTGRRLLLSTSRLSSISLSWSPDGKEIVIASPGPNANGQCKTRLYLVPIDGGQPVSLRTAGGCDVAWSPRGDQIAYDRGGEIFVMRSDGTGSREVAKGGGPRWSADGVQLAFGVRIRLHRAFTLGAFYTAFGVVDADGEGFHVVTAHAYTEYSVAWSPAGRRILYGRADRKGIYVIDADSRDNHRITRNSPPQAGWGALAWSPTGGSIVYTAGPADNTDLYVIGADGRNKLQLTNTRDVDIDPSWSAGS
jgi:Tol biopolymer transport system component